jgi:hypothetical protein
MQLAIWYFGFLAFVGLLFVAGFAGCLRLISPGPVANGYARLVGGGSVGIGVALIALATLLVAGYQLDSVLFGDLLQNGLLLVTLLAACGCGVAAYSLKGGQEEPDWCRHRRSRAKD